jgi:hypothetical protein
VEDGATPHTADASIEEITRHCFLCPGWRDNSPDLDPIEMLWSIMKDELNWSGIIKEIGNIWQATLQTKIDRL